MSCSFTDAALEVVSFECALAGLVSLVAAHETDHLLAAGVLDLVCLGCVGAQLCAVALLLVGVCCLSDLCHVRILIFS